jgi:hypothetical protein
MYRFSEISIKTPMTFFSDIPKENPKIFIKLPMTPSSQSNLE